MPLFTTGNSQADAAVGSALGGLFSNGVNSLAGRLGVNIGAGSPAATAAIKNPPIQGVPVQAVQPQMGAPWFRKPIVIVLAVVAVLGLVWTLVRRK